MPIFEYVCAACHHRFETLQTAAQSGRAACPRCGSEEARLQLSIFATSGPRTEGHGTSGPGGCGCGSSCGCRN